MMRVSSAAFGRLSRRTWVLALAATLLATAAAEGLFRSGFAERIEYFYYDAWHGLAGRRFSPAHVVTVIVDDPSLNAHPDEPLAFWTPHFAQALATLRAAGVKTVAVDFLFSGSPERWIAKLGLDARDASRDYDQAFRTQIHSGGVILAAYRVGAGATENDFVLPSPDYLLALPDLDLVSNVGLVNLRSDADGVVRRFVLAETSRWAQAEGMPQLAFAPLAAVKATGQDVQAMRWRFGQRDLAVESEYPITFAGPPGTFKALSFERLLRPNALSDPEVRSLSGKTVVLGAGYAGMNDVHPTPHSTSLAGGKSLMPGPEIQANIVETLLSGRFLDRAPVWLRIGSFGALFGVLAFVGVRLPPLQASALALSMVAASALAAYVLFAHDLLMPIAHVHIGLALVLMFLMLLRLTREERERARIGAVFGRYVSPQVMTSLLASPDLPELGGTSTHITVLFSDIRNFTTISEKLTAKEVVEMLNTYFERACAVLLAEGATIDKFIGDAIMAEFGAPLAQNDHAQRALRAAVALHQIAGEFGAWMRQRFPERALPDFAIGIGLHTGEAVVGNIGSSTRMEYTAIGDTVNIASRLEGLTKGTVAGILASRETVDAAGTSPIRTGARHSLAVKGRTQPVEAFEIVT